MLHQLPPETIEHIATLHQLPQETIEHIATYLPKPSLSAWVQASKEAAESCVSAVLYSDLASAKGIPPLSAIEKNGRNIHALKLDLKKAENQCTIMDASFKYSSYLVNLKKIDIFLPCADDEGTDDTLVALKAFLEGLPEPDKITYLGCHLSCPYDFNASLPISIMESIERFTHVREISLPTIVPPIRLATFQLLEKLALESLRSKDDLSLLLLPTLTCVKINCLWNPEVERLATMPSNVQRLEISNALSRHGCLQSTFSGAMVKDLFKAAMGNGIVVDTSGM
ncbi:hypothetical protein HDU97_010267 [Phlyctochytrium planicorne]|nr:hypothetical protein HDU97_010267 [Phlyctochytrium planicorne]